MSTTQSPTPSSSQNTAPTLEECPICLTEYSLEEVLKCSNGHTSACGYCLSKVVSDTCSICRISTMTEEEPTEEEPTLPIWPAAPRNLNRVRERAYPRVSTRIDERPRLEGHFHNLTENARHAVEQLRNTDAEFANAEGVMILEEDVRHNNNVQSGSALIYRINLYTARTATFTATHRYVQVSDGYELERWTEPINRTITCSFRISTVINTRRGNRGVNGVWRFQELANRTGERLYNYVIYCSIRGHI